MEAELEFEGMSPEAVERVARKVQSRLMFPQATDPMLAAFKEELKFAVAKKDKKERKKEEAAAKEAPEMLGLLRSFVAELRLDRDGGERDGGRSDKRLHAQGLGRLQRAQVLHLRQSGAHVPRLPAQQCRRGGRNDGAEEEGRSYMA